MRERKKRKMRKSVKVNKKSQYESCKHVAPDVNKAAPSETWL